MNALLSGLTSIVFLTCSSSMVLSMEQNEKRPELIDALCHTQQRLQREKDANDQESCIIRTCLCSYKNVINDLDPEEVPEELRDTLKKAKECFLLDSILQDVFSGEYLYLLISDPGPAVLQSTSEDPLEDNVSPFSVQN